jgi:hypothetical protein
MGDPDRGRAETGGKTMERLVLNIFGLVVALGTSGLMFAATVA